MTDLEDAARQAAQALGTLASSVREARESCTASFKVMGAASQRLATDRAGLSAATKALAEALDNAAERILMPAGRAQTALTIAGRTFDESSAEWTPLLEAEAQGLDALATQSREAAQALHGWSDDAVAHGEAVSGQAADCNAALHELVDDAEQSTAMKLPEWLGDAGGEVERAADQARQVMAEACAALLERKQAEWDGKLKDVGGLLEKAFADMQEHAEAVAGYALEQSASFIEAALERRGGEVSSVEMEVRELQAEVASAREQVSRLTQDLIDGLRGADQAVTATVQAWRETVERWRAVGYDR
jgi:hypothetical protein